MASNPDKNITPIGKILTVLEKPESIKRMIMGLGVFCFLLFAADFLHLRHGKFESENLFGFYGFFGFAAFAFIIFATKLLKALLGRKDNYYSPQVVDNEPYPDEELEVKEHGDG